MKRYWLALPVLAGAYLCVSAAAGIAASEMVVHGKRHSFEDAREDCTKQGLGENFDWYDSMEWTPFTVKTGDGLTLSGEYLKNPAPGRKKVAIFAHGHTVDRGKSLKYAPIFWRLGYSVVLYDERYFGRSEGEYSTLAQEEAKDLCAVIRKTRELFGEDIFLALHGESMGAATVLSALRWEKPDFVIADCPFSDSVMLFRYLTRKRIHILPWPALWISELYDAIRYDYHPRRVNPIDAVRETETPICFMHGAADTYIPCIHSVRMYGECKNPLSELHLFPDAKHAKSIFIHREEYERIAEKFIRKIEKEAGI